MLPTMVVEGFHHQLSLPVYREDGDIPISPRFFCLPIQLLTILHHGGTVVTIFTSISFGFKKRTTPLINLVFSRVTQPSVHGDMR
jgi:hypothetical protein